MHDSSIDYYEVLHLHPSAHPDVVQAAYRRLALLYHPDKNPSPEATNLMALVNQAYEVLSDPEKRSAYDHSRKARENRPTPPPSSGTSTGSRSDASAGTSSGMQSGTDAEFITLGSSREEVARIQGVPDDVSSYGSLGEEIWHYGEEDSITFDLATGRVRGWSNIIDNLRVQLVPGPNVSSSAFFTVGAHRDDVARLQGTPHHILAVPELDREMWLFDDGSVEFSFSTGRVTDWEDDGGALRARSSQPHSGTRSSAAGGQRRPTSGGARIRGYSNWRVVRNEFNSGARTRDVSIATRSLDDSEYTLFVRFAEGELEIFVGWDTDISYSDETSVSWQIDNGLLQRGSWDVGTSRESTFMPKYAVLETIRAFSNAELFSVVVYPFGGRPITATFRVSGFSTVAEPVLEAWRQAGRPSPRQAAEGGGGCFLLPLLGLVVVAAAVPAVVVLL